MAKEKIACIAGTPVDTKMGADLLRNNGYEAYEFPSSANPTEENLFQISPIEEKNRKILTILNKIKDMGIEKVFVYCNSLSSAVNFNVLSKDTGLKIITPYDVYKNEAKDYNCIGVISANAVATSKIEKVYLENNKNISIISIGMLSIVLSIEKGLSPKEIIEKHKLDLICKWFKENGAEAVLLGCTHFPYFRDELEKVSELTIIDPNGKMVELLKIS